MLTKIIEQSKIDHFAKWMERADKIVIVAHVSPDGDAVGSSLGLWHFLNTQDKDVTVIVPNAFPDFCGGCLVAKIYFCTIVIKNLLIS